MGKPSGHVQLIASGAITLRQMKRKSDMTPMTKTLVSSLSALVLVPAAAFAVPAVGDTVGTTAEEITNNLQAAGYEVREIELDDDELEALIVADAQLFELEVSPQTGLITEVELEDDDDMDDAS
jgi:hypothetical protein